MSAAASGAYAASTYLPDSEARNPATRTAITPMLIPYWTSTTWFLLADPNKVPCIAAGFLGGRDTPEIVTEPSDTGSHFTADKIRIKVKNYRAVVAVDHRGIYGQVE